MRTNLFMMFILLLSMLLLGPYSYAKSKKASVKAPVRRHSLSPGAQKAQEYFKHDDDYALTMKVIDPSKAKVASGKYKKRKIASQSKKSKLLKKTVAQIKRKKSDSKQRRQLASKGVPLKLPKKKIN